MHAAGRDADASPARPAPTGSAGAIAALSHLEPDLLVGSGSGPPLAALWSHVAITTPVNRLPQHAIALHLGGSTLVEKWSDGRLVGRGSRIGSVTLVPAWAATQWVIDGPTQVGHLYVDPATLGNAVLRDFFAERDDTLATIVRAVLLPARAAAHTAAATPLDPLQRDQIECRVREHLLLHYTDGPRPPQLAAPVALTSHTLRRLFEHIEARLDLPLRLHELAAIARVSDDHFLRAFKSAVGQTPGQYVLERRVARAVQLLERSSLPLAEVARRTGFRGASHFAATFRQRLGVSPRSVRANRLKGWA